MANPFAKYVQPQEEVNPFAKYAQPEPTPEENPFAKYAVPEVSPTAVPNPLQGAEPATAQAPMQPAQEESGLWELPKGLVRGAYSVAQMVPEFMSRQYALGAGAPEAALSAFDKIDAGELKSTKDINAFISPRKLPTERTAEEIAQMVQGESTAGQKLHAISLAKDYLAASPEERKALREQISSDIQASLKSFGEQQAKVEEYKKAAEPYKARVESFADIEGLGDVGSYVGSKLGEAIPQFGPVLASGILTRGRGVVPTSVAMELPGAVQDRIDFAAKKLEGETDPTKRASALAKYVRDTNDVTFTAAVMSGILDGVLGPEAGIAKAMAAGSLRDQTRKEILKALPKVAAKSGAEEFLTGGMQETVMINAERILGEQGGDAFTKENIIRVVDSALSEAIGGLGISTGVEAGRAAFAKKNLAELDTPEGRAMRGLDTLADEEEAAAPKARTVEDLTAQEVDGIQRRLYAELGRPADEQELMGAFNDYIANQNAGAGTQPGANVSGVPSTTPTAGGAEAAATPDTGGLGESGLAPVQPTAGANAEPSALESARQELEQAQRIYEESIRALEEAQRGGNDGEIAGAQGTFAATKAALDDASQTVRRKEEHEEARGVARANVDSAIADQDNFNSLEEALDSYRGNVFDTLDEQGIRDERTHDEARKEFDRLAADVLENSKPKAEEVLDEDNLTFTDEFINGLEEEVPATDVGQTINAAAQELFDTNPDYDSEEYDAAETKLIQTLRDQGASDEALKGAYDAFSNRLVELDTQRPGRIARSLSEDVDTTEGPYHAEAPLVGSVPANQRGITKLRKLFQEGKLTDKQYIAELNNLLDEMADQRDMRNALKSGLPGKRGLGRVISAIEDAVKAGKLTAEAGEFVKWLLMQNPAIANGLAIEIALPKTARESRALQGTAGYYDAMLRLVRLVARKDPVTGKYAPGNPTTAVHEILHHMERMLPNNLRGLIRVEWSTQLEKALAKARKENNANVIEYLTTALEANATQDEVLFNRASKMVSDGKVPRSMYQLLNPSEFWAVRGTDILSGKFKTKNTGLVNQLRRYMREFLEAIKQAFGLPSDDSIIKGLQAVLKGDGTFVSRYLLSEGTIAPSLEGWDRAETDIGEEEKKLAEQFRRAGDLRPDVVAAIENNDLNGALNILANRLGGFYGELAARLAGLNLQTSIAIGNGRDVAHRAILATVGPQLQRIASYIQVADPDLYKRRFEGFENSENMVNTSIGITVLMTKKQYPEIATEIEDANDAFRKFMSAATAPGAYYNMFDTITLDPKGIEGIGNRVFLHEVVHAATVSLMRADPSQLTKEQLEAREEIRKLFATAKKNIATNEYGLRDEYEFVAEIFTNDEFRKLLKGIPYAPARTNVLSRFFNAILRLVGAGNLASTAMTEANKLFTSARYQELKPGGPLLAQGKKKFRYRKGPLTSSAWRTAEYFKDKLINSHPTWANAFNAIRDRIWDPATGKSRITILGALELRHISDISRNKFPQVAAAIRIIEKMIAHRGRIMTEAAAISKDWMEAQKKSLAKSQLLGRLMLETTISGVEVDPTNKAYYDATKVKPQLQAAWDALGPNFQNIYRRVRDFYKKQMQDTIRQMKDRANLINDPEQRQKVIDLINRDFGPDKLKFPYFPLKRFGQYWFQVGSGNTKEFYEFESMGARNSALRQRREELLAGNAAQRALVDSIEVGNSISTLLSQTSDVSTALNTVNELIDSLPDNFNDLQDQDTIENVIGNVQETLREEINQLLYTMMPQQSLRKQMISRKAIQGASADMLRVFTNSATRIAYQQARAKYSSEFIANLNNARNYIKDIQATSTPEQREVYRDILHEVELRYKPMLGMEDTSTSARIAGIASDAITTFMMSAPMSAFLQTIGAFQFAAPQLGGRYGYVKATDRMWENFKDYAGSTVERTLMPLKNGQMFSVSFPSVMESSKLTGLDKMAAQQLIDEEQVNVSQTYDLVGVGARPSELTLSKYEAFKRAVFAPLHQAERFNREIVLLSTFQLEYEKLMSGPKKDHNGVVERDAQGNPVMYQKDATTPDGVAYSTEAYDAALTHAKDVTAITLGETTRQMRPRYFMNALLALPLKFKRYMITAIYSMYRNFNAGFVQPFKKEELDQMRKILKQDKQPPDVIDRKIKEMEAFRKELATEGRKALIGTLVNTGLFTGLAGMPFYSTVFPLIIGMFTSDDDDDEFFDFDNWFRNYMESEFGGYIAGMLAKTGMLPQTAEKVGRRIGESIAVGPATVLTGGSFTERASIDIKSLMFRDARYSPTSRGAMQEAITTAAGPAAGLVLNWADAKDLWHQGQYMRAAEKGLPAIFGKPLGAVRLATDDAKTKRGDTLVSDITETEIAMQAIGLTPHRVAKAQRQSIQAVEKVQKIQNKRNNIMNDLWMAQSTGDAEGVLDAANKAVEFSTKYPSYAITPQLMQDSFKTRMKQQGLANAVGARVQEKDLPIVLPMLNRGD